jgi:hypothetical protein
VRKSKLYYIRGASGRASKIKEQIGPLKSKGPAVEVDVPSQSDAEPAT